MRRFIVDQQAEDIETPDNLRLNTFLKKYQSECTHKGCNIGYYGFAFGQSPFPVPRVVQEALRTSSDKGYYAPISGVTELREAISEYNQKYFKLDVDPGRIYVGPGTKELIFNLLEMLYGTVILPTPSWLGYLPQIRLLRKNFHILPTGTSNKINPKSLEHLALRLQDRQKILFLNNPHNPTGLLYSRLELEEITDICRNYDILVISDEIYAQTTYNFKEFVSMGRIYPEGTFVTNGLSKSHSAGGYRLGYVIFPPHTPEIKHQYKKILATEYTATSTPIQFAAIAGFKESPEMDRYFETTREIHRTVGEYTYNALRAIDGVKATKPEATFYLLADFNHFTDDFHANKIYTSKQFSESLIEHPYHTAIVGGDSLVLERVDFRARIAFVDYDGTRAMRSYLSDPPKTSSEKIKFVEKNAPRVAAGIRMIGRYLDDLQDQAIAMAKKKTAQSITFQ